MAEQYSVARVYHILFIHSLAGGYLGGFHVMAVVKRVYKCLCEYLFPELWGVCPGAELLGHMAVLWAPSSFYKIVFH